jgi:arylsulfatase A-like enzyme
MRRRAFFAAFRQALASPRPNVLLYLPAQMRACDLGCYGGGVNVSTPNFDRVAREGRLYRHAISTVPLSTPFRAMLQTGRLAEKTRVIVNGLNVRADNTLAQSFAKAGYATAYIGCWHLAAGRLANPAVKTHAEFVPPGPARMGYQIWHAFNYHTEFARPYFYRDEPRRLLMPGYETDAEAAMALEVMHECRVSNKPFLLMVAPHPPHPPWRESHTPPEALAQVAAELKWRPNVRNPQPPEGQDPRCYYGLLKSVDQNLGKMLDYMDKYELTPNTIVLCASDHGEMLGSHGLWGSQHPYIEALQIPLLLRWPGQITAGTVANTLVTPVDVFPSLLELCGLKAPAGIDGHALFGPRPLERRRAEIANYSGHPENLEDGNEWRGWYSPNRITLDRRRPAAGSSYRGWFTPEREIL